MNNTSTTKSHDDEESFHAMYPSVTTTTTDMTVHVEPLEIAIAIEDSHVSAKDKPYHIDNNCCTCRPHQCLNQCLSPFPCVCTVLCCYGGKCSYKICKMTRLQVALIICLVILLLLFGIFGIVPFDHAGQPIRPLTTAMPSAISKQQTRVLLYGDSQWGIVERYHHLTTKIQAYLPEYPMTFTVVGDLGVKAKDLNDRLQRYKSVAPHAVLINLDSDCSNVNEDAMSTEHRTVVRAHYRANISAVVEFWLSTGAVVALGGPVLLGEGPLRPLNVARFVNKDVMLNAYVEMNKEVAAAYSIPFMDFRAKLISALPWYRFYYNGYVTKGYYLRLLFMLL